MWVKLFAASCRDYNARSAAPNHTSADTHLQPEIHGPHGSRERIAETEEAVARRGVGLEQDDRQVGSNGHADRVLVVIRELPGERMLWRVSLAACGERR